MTRRFLLPAALAAFALVIPATATAKGPSEATITGPGLSSPIKFTGNSEGGWSNAFGQLVQWGGFFPQTFGQSPDPVLRARPNMSLGPRYSVTYIVPGPSTDTLRQDLYPYAASGPVTYMEPGQKFWGDQKTHGGWYRGYSELKSTLIEAGLPKKAPATHDRVATVRKIALGAGAGVVLAAAALALIRRRR
jgi:hypothetical protein